MMLSIAMLVYACTPDIVAMTERNVGTLLRNTTGEFELRVLFNGGPAVALPAHPALVPIYIGERQSIAKAYNLAFSCARGDVYACVHNDVSVPYGWNEYLRPGDDFVFPMACENAADCADRGIDTLPPYSPPGCCFVFSKDTYMALGGFDEAFEGCHFEDTDLWMKALAAGKRLVRRDVMVEHGRGKTRTAIPGRANDSFRANAERYANRYRREDGSVPLPSISQVPQEN